MDRYFDVHDTKHLISGAKTISVKVRGFLPGSTIMSYNSSTKRCWSLQVGPNGSPKLVSSDGKELVSAYADITGMEWHTVTIVITSTTRVGILVDGIEAPVRGETNMDLGACNDGNYVLRVGPGEVCDLAMWDEILPWSYISVPETVSMGSMILWFELKPNQNTPTDKTGNLAKVRLLTSSK